MKALLDLFKQVTQKEEFDSIKIGFGFARKNTFMVIWRSQEARNHQLSYIQTGTGRIVLCQKSLAR